MKLVWKMLMAAGVTALALSSCALSGGPISAQVVDETTGKPVADAIVVIHWHGSWTKIVGESSSGCYHVETARTDANGMFEIEKWKRAWHSSDLRFSPNGMDWLAYKPGYWRGKSGMARPDTLYIAPLNDTKAAYFETVLSAPAWACPGAGESHKNEYRLLHAMATEARMLAETPAQMGRAQMLAESAENSLINRDKPTEYDDHARLRNVDPRDSFKKEEVPQ
jgi:hypothetical protein